jgi:hypothetical protein
MSCWLTTLGALLLCCSASSTPATPCAPITLVLAIDSSSSVDEAEFDLQMQGIALAVMDPDVVSAMQAAGGVAVAAVLWGDSAWRAQVTDWHLVSSMHDAERFAAGLMGQPRLVGGNTDMGYGINVALDLLANPDNCATRLVIDVSGDGRETLYSRRPSISLSEVQERAEAMGVIINGLAITTDDPDLMDYYALRVILGPGSFVMSVTDYTVFREAIKRKLLREIGEPLVPALAGLANEGMSPVRTPGWREPPMVPHQR